jgi:hypothetical protein
LSATPATRSRTGRDTRKQASSASEGWVAPGPMRQPLEPTSFATRKTLEGPPREASPSRHSLTRRVLEQSSQMMSKASLAPRYCHGPHSTTARPSWTLAHVDRRLIYPNCHLPDLSRYIRDKVRPRGGGRSEIDHFTPHLICSCSAPRAGQPREGHRELLHFIPSSSSSPTGKRLHRR